MSSSHRVPKHNRLSFKFYCCFIALTDEVLISSDRHTDVRKVCSLLPVNVRQAEWTYSKERSFMERDNLDQLPHGRRRGHDSMTREKRTFLSPSFQPISSSLLNPRPIRHSLFLLPSVAEFPCSERQSYPRSSPSFTISPSLSLDSHP